MLLHPITFYSFFPYFRTRKQRIQKAGMKAYTIHYKNKIHDFHAWGVAALI